MKAIIVSSAVAILLPRVASAQPTTAPAPANPEPANAEPANAEPANAEPANTEPANTEPANTAAVSTAVSTEISATSVAEPDVQGAWSFGVAPRLAMTVPTSRLKKFVVGGLELAATLPVANRRLVVALDLAITRPSYDGSGTDPRVNGGYSYAVKEREVKLGLDAIFRFFDAREKVVPYVGAGPVICLLQTTESTSFAPGDNMEQDTKLGFEVVGGADFRVGPGMVLAELRVVYSGLDHLLTGESNAGNVMFGVGYRFVF